MSWKGWEIDDVLPVSILLRTNLQSKTRIPEDSTKAFFSFDLVFSFVWMGVSMHVPAQKCGTHTSALGVFARELATSFFETEFLAGTRTHI